MDIKKVHQNIQNRVTGTIPDETIVCRCMEVRAGEIRECIRQGNTTLDSLEEKLGVMSACGFCRFRIQKILEEELWAEESAGEG